MLVGGLKNEINFHHEIPTQGAESSDRYLSSLDTLRWTSSMVQYLRVAFPFLWSVS
jgi:hypothetical protein